MRGRAGTNPVSCAVSIPNPLTFPITFFSKTKITRRPGRNAVVLGLKSGRTWIFTPSHSLFGYDAKVTKAGFS